MAWLVFGASLVLAYLFGSVNAAIIISKIVAHKDVRDYGSGNAGMTNVVRVMGLKPGIYTFLIDSVKGAMVCLLARLVAFPYIYGQLGIEMMRPEYAVYYCGLLCLIGHIYPVFFGFRGGKGVATSLGVLLVCQWQAALIALGVFVILFIITKTVSICSISVVVILPFLNIIFANGEGENATLIQCLLMAVISFLVIFMHRSNIVRIIHGEEKKLSLGGKKESDDNAEA